MSVISMKQLLEAGVHFGHQTRRWNPKMAEFIFTERNGIYIIDLQKTVQKMDEAYYFIREVAESGKGVLFVGTKKQAQESMEEEALRSEQFFVNARWLGGMLTNFKTMRKRVERLKQLEKMEEEGVFDVLPKKEVIKLRAEMQKLEKNMGGIKEMTELPGVMFVVDPKKEKNAISEAKKLGIPVVAIVDTNCDPDEIDYIIPGNDDAIRAVKLISAKIADAIIEAKQGVSFYDGDNVSEEQEDGAEVEVTMEAALGVAPPEVKKEVVEAPVAEEAKAETEASEEEKPKKKAPAKKKEAEVAETSEAEATVETEVSAEAEVSDEEKPKKKAPAKKKVAEEVVETSAEEAPAEEKPKKRTTTKKKDAEAPAEETPAEETEEKPKKKAPAKKKATEEAAVEAETPVEDAEKE